jgi:hypothetical protein
VFAFSLHISTFTFRNLLTLRVGWRKLRTKKSTDVTRRLQVVEPDKIAMEVLKAAWQPQLIFSVMLGGIGGLLLINGLLSHRADWLQGAAIFGLLWAAFYCMVSRLCA